MKESSDAVDLLTLIGKAIGHLQEGIAHFEEADKGTGLSCLSMVIDDIDAYLAQVGDDPLVPLAHVDPTRLQESLHHVQRDLSAVIEQIERPSTP